MLYIKKVEAKGRGVFSDRDIACGEIIEECPIVIIESEETGKYEGTILDSYMFGWGNEKRECLVTGYGMLYNHSKNDNNAESIEDHERELMVFRAVKDIPAHEEICFDYTSGANRDILFEEGRLRYDDGLPWWVD